jgi:hypothetical protein
MFYLAILFLLNICFAQKENEVRLNIGQMIQKYGFEYEEHTVLTKDGFHLTLDRIKTEGAPAVLFAHGQGGAATDYLINTVE